LGLGHCVNVGQTELEVRRSQFSQKKKLDAASLFYFLKVTVNDTLISATVLGQLIWSLPTIQFCDRFRFGNVDGKIEEELEWSN
jgi:hypothetical protein